jgi:hypothetical protein
MTEQSPIDMFNDPVRFRDGDLPETLPSDEPSDGAMLPYVLRVLSVGEQPISRWQLIRELTRQIPLDDHNLPLYLYRSDLLDPTLLLGPTSVKNPSSATNLLESSIIHVTWDQGFPTIHQEDPLWAKLQFEPENAFRAFLMYAEQSGIRQLNKIEHESRDLLVEWYHLYYWAARSKALDLFRAAHHFRLRERRILDLEDNHWIEGEKIMKRLQNAIANKTEEQLAELDIDKLISSMEKVAKIQRSAVGLSASGGDVVAPKSTSVEVAIRNASDDGTQHKTEDSAIDPALFEDAEILSNAQDLIIKVSNR